MTVSAHVLAAALTAVSANGSRISETSMRAALEAALAVLSTPQGDASLDLQPGEQYLVHNTHENEVNLFRSREALNEEMEHLVDAYDIGSNYRSIDEYCEVFIVRRQVTVESEKTVKVTLS